MIEARVLDGAESGDSVQGRGVLTVGRAWMNDLVLWSAPRVSSRHGQIEERDGELWYRDLGSRNGSRVERAGGGLTGCEPGGEAVKLEPGDVLRLGSQEAPVRVAVSLAEAGAAPGLRWLATVASDASLAEETGVGLAARPGHSFTRFLMGLLGNATPEQAVDLLAGAILEGEERFDRVAVFLTGEDPVAVRSRVEEGRWLPGAEHRALLERVRSQGEAVVADLPGAEGGGAAACASIPGDDDALGAVIAEGAAGALVREEVLASLQAHAHFCGRVLEGALRRRSDAGRMVELSQQNEELRQRLQQLEPGLEIVGQDPLLGQTLAQAERVAPYPTPVLITGPSGTGKELVARAIHQLSDRRSEPMLAVNCGALSDNLLESELFGHTKGAFTGADRTKLGLFEAADGGTLLLDEVGEVSPALQVKLLRVLQEGEFFRVGSTRPVRVDVRVLAATHRDLQEEVRKGDFREDLYYRLAVFPVDVPPLKDRPGDIPLLAAHFVERFAARFRKGPMSLGPAALDSLCQEAWPGNVRELQNRMERAVILCDGATVEPAHVAPMPGGGGGAAEGGRFLPLKEARRVFTRDYLQRALARADGVQRDAARLLDMDPGNLSRLLKELELR